MAQTPEGRVKAELRNQLLSWGLINAGISALPPACKGWFYFPQNIGMGVNGIPDIVGCIGKGLFFSIEAKAQGKKPSPTQVLRHNEIRLAGGIVCVADCVDDIQFLKEYL